MKMSADDIARYPKFHNYVKWGSNPVINVMVLTTLFQVTH